MQEWFSIGRTVVLRFARNYGISFLVQQKNSYFSPEGGGSVFFLDVVSHLQVHTAPQTEGKILTYRVEIATRTHVAYVSTSVSAVIKIK